MRKKRLNAEPGEFVLMRIRDMHNTHRVTHKESVMLSVVRLSEALKKKTCWKSRNTLALSAPRLHVVASIGKRGQVQLFRH